MEHVTAVLEQIENGLLTDVGAVELYACAGGCFGSPLLPLDFHVTARRWAHEEDLASAADAPVSEPNSPLSRSCRFATSSSRWVPRWRAAFCRMARSLVGFTGFSMKS